MFLDVGQWLLVAADFVVVFVDAGWAPLGAVAVCRVLTVVVVVVMVSVGGVVVAVIVLSELSLWLVLKSNTQYNTIQFTI
jgi:hypothetical protein